MLARRAALRVTAEIGAGGDYGDAQAFAADALRTGFDGIRWLVRNDPAQKLVGIALFGCSDAASVALAVAPPGDEPILQLLLADARRRSGYRVLPRP